MSINLGAKSEMFNFITKAKGRIQDVTRGIYMEIGERIIARSPVGNPALWHPAIAPKGYRPGHFINNWQVGIDVVPFGVIDAVDPTGAASRLRLRKLGRWQVGHIYYFVNNLPYANLLESGLWSKQVGPAGMVGLTRLEFNQIAIKVQQEMGLSK